MILSNLPADFLDVAEDFNGYNHEWLRLYALAGWNIKLRVQTTVISQNTVKTITDDTTLTLHDYDDGAGDWTSGAISCFDGATPLSIGGQPYLMDASAGRNTTVRADFTYNGAGSMPVASNVFVVFRIIPKEVGTYIANDSFSSMYNRSSVSLFTNANGLVDITAVSATEMRAECEIDYNKLPIGIQEFTISAFIREK